MGVWLPDGWMESAPAGFPLPPLIPPGPSFSSHCGERRGEEIGVWGQWLRRRPQTPSFLPLPAPRSGEGLTRVGFSGERQGGGVEGLPPIRECSFKPSACPVESY